jgi:hypothetical protein
MIWPIIKQKIPIGKRKIRMNVWIAYNITHNWHCAASKYYASKKEGLKE